MNTHARCLALCSAVLLTVGCTTQSSSGAVTLSAASLTFDHAWVGIPKTQSLTVTNSGGDATFAVSATGPFSAGSAMLTLKRGDSIRLDVTYLPVTAGHDLGALHVGTAAAALSGTAMKPADCPTTECTTGTTDPATGACTLTKMHDGRACTTPCGAGACEAGDCVPAGATCDDHDACTHDACADDGGCTHAPVVCTGSDDCHSSSCDSALGCQETPKPDGAPCGSNACTATGRGQCLAASCHLPPAGACANTWTTPYIDADTVEAVAYDSDRQRLVVFGYGDHYQSSETWEYDGTGWTSILAAGQPPPLDGASMAYDSTRKRTVLFGNDLSPASNPLTFEWDGSQWNQMSPAHTPSGGRQFPAMAYDSMRQKTVLFGGLELGNTDFVLNDFWEWDGTDWTQRNFPMAPPGRSHAMLAYDPARERLTLFGGAPFSNSSLGDTWENDGTSWHQLPTSALAPPSRSSGGLAYDPRRHVMVLFGGESSAGNTLGDTWEWDGTAWQERMPAVPPDARAGNFLYFDAHLQSVVSFAGRSIGYQYVESRTVEQLAWDGQAWSPTALVLPTLAFWAGGGYDSKRQRAVFFGDEGWGAGQFATWEWDGVEWSGQTFATQPGPRDGAAVAYDEAIGQLMLYGGCEDPAGSALNDTWLYDGTQWTQVMPASAPAVRCDAAVAYDPDRKKVVLFGGRLGFNLTNYYSDTWEFDGTGWTQVPTPHAPTKRAFAPMAYDPVAHQMVLFGGDDNTSSKNDTWVYDGVDWSPRTPAHAPVRRWATAMATDVAGGKVLLYGGCIDGVFPDSNDLWAWDGTDWTLQTTLNSAKSHCGSSAVFDSTRRQLLAASGSRGFLFGSGTSDLWVFTLP